MGCSTPEICEEQITWAPGSPQIGIPANDKILICGDPTYRSWEKIPPGQSAKFLRSYLESKAYLDPKITVDYDASKVVVNAGKRTVVTAIITEGEPVGWKTGPLEIYLDQPLDKTTLDQIQNYSLELLKGMGYACAKVNLTAHTDGRVILGIRSGAPQFFPPTVDLETPEVDVEILGRYEPFHIGDPFDIRKTTLAGRRMEDDSVASSAQYVPTCEGNELRQLNRAAAFGPRRAWEIGAGASTEEYPLTFIRWKSSRLWSSASNFQAQTFASNIRQNVSVELKWFPLKTDRRFYLRPGAQIERRSELKFRTIERKVTGYLGRTFDIGDFAIDPQVGFTARRLHQYKSANDGVNDFLTPGAILNIHTHEYELFRGSPRTGSDLTLTYDFIPGSQVKQISVHRLFAQGTLLWNYKDYVEPRWVLGARYSFGTVMTSDRSTPDPNRVPKDFFFLVGGDRDLRGFARSSLPDVNRVTVRDPATGLIVDQTSASVATTGIESRWPNLFAFPLEPLVFFDFGWVGTGNLQFDRTFYSSPGIGARSATPLGTIRATFAKGYIPRQQVRRNQFFISFGTEF